MSDDQIADDLGRKLGAEIDAVLRRELRIAQSVLPATGVVMIYLELAARVASSAIGTAIAQRKPDAVPADLYDLFAARLAEVVATHKEKTLATVVRLEREAAAA